MYPAGRARNHWKKRVGVFVFHLKSGYTYHAQTNANSKTRQKHEEEGKQIAYSRQRGTCGNIVRGPGLNWQPLATSGIISSSFPRTRFLNLVVLLLHSCCKVLISRILLFARPLLHYHRSLSPFLDPSPHPSFTPSLLYISIPRSSFSSQVTSPPNFANRYAHC